MKKERNTEQKEILLNYLKENKDKHLSINDIYNNVKNEVGLTTIYRIINNLIKKGVVTKIPLENKQGFCYRYNSASEECSNHYHLICEKCNKLFHFESKEFNRVNIEAKKSENFEIDNDRVILYGICKQCRENRR